jgi:hypothetical protein
MGKQRILCYASIVLSTATTFACGQVDVTPTQPEFSDAGYDAEFSLGTFLGTRWAGDRLEVEPGLTSGEFVSRIFDSGTTHTWSSLSWEPGAPYGKALPDNGTAEQGYRS